MGFVLIGSLVRAPVGRWRRERLVIQTFTSSSTIHRDGITKRESVRARLRVVHARDALFAYFSNDEWCPTRAVRARVVGGVVANLLSLNVTGTARAV